MSKFYFVGGPEKGQEDEFFRRLEAVGGVPHGWSIYPHESGDGRALHLVNAGSEEEIVAHLAHFDGIYQRSEITRILEPRG